MRLHRYQKRKAHSFFSFVDLRSTQERAHTTHTTHTHTHAQPEFCSSGTPPMQHTAPRLTVIVQLKHIHVVVFSEARDTAHHNHGCGVHRGRRVAASCRWRCAHTLRQSPNSPQRHVAHWFATGRGHLPLVCATTCAEDQPHATRGQSPKTRGSCRGKRAAHG